MKTFLSTAVLVATLPAFAETSVPVEPFDEVVVTVKRRAADKSEVSAAVGIVDGEAVRRQKLVTDALADTAGVFLQQTTPGQGTAIVRGLYGSAVLHLVDGIRLNNAIFRNAPTQYLAMVPTTAIDRVEVVRGTQTSLYGSDAIGGVVQVVTRIPSFDSDGYDIRGESLLGFDTAEESRTVKSTIDVGNRRFATSLGAEFLHSGDRLVGGGDRIGPSGYESRGGRLMFAATPADDTTWLMDLQFFDQPETPRVDELVPGFGQSEPSSAEFVFKPNQRRFVHARRSRAAGAFGVDWAADLAWQQVVDDRITRDFGSRERSRESNSSDLYAATLSAAGNTARWSWISGAELYFDRVRSTRFGTDIDTGQISLQPARFADGSSVRQAAIYASSDRNMADKHLLTAGLRFSQVSIDLAQSDFSPAANIDADDVSGDLGWIYSASESTQLVANLGIGFRAPNVFDLSSLGNRPGNRFSIPNTSLDSEHVVQADLGIRVRKQRWNGEFVLFALRYDDRITTVLTGATTPGGRDIVQSRNAGRTSIRGIESRLQARLSDAVVVDAVLNYTRGEQKEPRATAEPADRTPPLHGKVQVSHDAGTLLRLDAWLRFAAEQHRLSARDVRDVRIDPAGTAGWGIAGVQATRELNGGWQASVGLDNLLDKRYRLHGSGVDAVGRNLYLNIFKSW